MGWAYVSSQPVGAAVVAWFVILLPAIDIGSAFPLIATSLANTFEALIYTNENVAYDPRYIVVIKVLLCTCVSALALAEYDFELILALSGAFKLLATYAGMCLAEEAGEPRTA